MFSILVDETTDISVSKQMIMYARVVDKDFTGHSHFVVNIRISNVKSDAQVQFGMIEQYLLDKMLTNGHGNTVSYEKFGAAGRY